MKEDKKKSPYQIWEKKYEKVAHLCSKSGKNCPFGCLPRSPNCKAHNLPDQPYRDCPIGKGVTY